MASKEYDNLDAHAQFWSEIPTAVIQAELRKRQDATRPACGGKSRGKYDTAIHVGALVLILVLSVTACAFPILAKRFPRLPIPHMFLFLSRHFGTGVLIATAFVHLFPTAYISLTDACLSPFWNKGYPAMPGLIAMMSVFMVVGIEMFFAMRGAGHMHDFDSFGFESEEASANQHERSDSHASSVPARRISFKKRPPHLTLHQPSSTDNLMAGQSPSVLDPTPRPEYASFPNTPNGRNSIESADGFELNELGNQDSRTLLNSINKPDPESDAASTSGNANGPDKKALLQCLLLEAGILFHSVFIGMALSVTPAPAFWVLLIAISFHQTFEGLALGSRISALAFPARSIKPWLMALAYGTTTPFGQAIGLAIHRMYDPESEVGLLSVGIMNAISSGLLLFAGLVELLAADFLSDESYVSLRGKKRYQACGSVVAGASLMALVGAWA